MAWNAEKEHRFFSRLWQCLRRAVQYRWTRLKAQTLFVLYAYVEELGCWLCRQWRTQEEKLVKQLLEDLQNDRLLK